MDGRRRDRLVDAGMVVAAAALGVLFWIASLDTDPSDLPPVPVELAVGACALAAMACFHRRRPVTLVLVLIPTSMVFTMAIGAVTLTLLAVAVRRTWRVTVAVAGLHMLTVTALYRLAIPDDRVYLESVIVMLFIDTVVVTSGMLTRSQRLLVESLRERARQSEQEQRMRVEEARLLERERLAREMHDVLAHRISLLAVHAGALEFRRSASDEERQAAGVIRQGAHDALEDLRQVLGMLREQPDEDRPRPQPTLADLPALVEEARRAGAPVAFDNRVSDLAAVPAGVGRHAYRIVQEGLTNARKHAPGAGVRVVLEESAGQGLSIEISNPLPPGSVPASIPGAGAGLIGLRERVGLIGGQLTDGRTSGGDFTLWAWLPWQR